MGVVSIEDTMVPNGIPIPRFRDSTRVQWYVLQYVRMVHTMVPWYQWYQLVRTCVRTYIPWYTCTIGTHVRTMVTLSQQRLEIQKYKHSLGYAEYVHVYTMVLEYVPKWYVRTRVRTMGTRVPYGTLHLSACISSCF